jgi:arylsulfatase
VRLFCACLTALALAAPLPAAEPKKPNVILIIADDLGYGELGCYGQKKIKTPSLDRMAKDGLRFTQFYCGSPVCAPSRCSLMTGKHGGHAWVRSNLAVGKEGQTPVPKGEVMFPELLAKEGYVNGAIGKWGLGFPDSEADPIKRGFELFYGYNCQGHAHNHYPTYLRRNDKKETLEGNDGGDTGKQYSHDLFEREALAFLEKNKAKTFFLYLPFTIPHCALQVPEDSLNEYKGKLGDDPPYEGKSYRKHKTPRAAYAAMITRMDRTVGRILDRLKELKLEKDTLVIFTSDNGAAHDYGGVDTKFFDSVGKLRGRKGDVYEGGIRVPMIARWTGTIKPGVSDHVGYFPDFMPTLLELCGATARLPKGIDGVSFAPTLLGKKDKQQEHKYLMWEFHGYGGQQAVRMGDWKGLRRDLHKKGKTKLELYDLSKDLSETTDLAEKNPDLVKKMEHILDTDRVPSKLFPIKCLDGK